MNRLACRGITSAAPAALAGFLPPKTTVGLLSAPPRAQENFTVREWFRLAKKDRHLAVRTLVRCRDRKVAGDITIVRCSERRCTVATHHNLTMVAAGIVRKTPVPETMDAGMKMAASTETEIPTRTHLNTRGIPITDTTNTIVSSV